MLRISGANQKDLLLFAHLAKDSRLSDWVCRVETDSYFVPANFQRFVRGRRLDPEEIACKDPLKYCEDSEDHLSHLLSN